VGAENAGEDLVDEAELALEIESVFEVLGSEEFRDARIAGDAITETGFGLPGGHGVFLDGFVGIVAGHALFDEVLQELAGKDQAAGGFEVAEHALRENAEFADDLGHFVEHVVDEDGGIGEDDALDAAVGDVAFVPQGNVFVGGEHVAADDASEAADLLGGDGIALVGHSGTAALLGAEMFLGFADFGALEMADFDGNFFEGGSDERQGAEILRVAIALDDLGGDGSDVQAEFVADFFLNVGAQVGSVADGAGDFSELHVAGGFAETGNVALILGEPVGDFQAKGDGFGVNAVGAADLRGVLELVGAEVEDFAEEDEVAFDEARGLADEECLGGVDDVVGGHAVVEPAGGLGITDGFADGHGEGDDVVLDAGFELVDALGVDFGFRAKHGGGVFGDEAGFGESVGGGEFDVEPALVFVGVAPDAAHIFAGVA